MMSHGSPPKVAPLALVPFGAKQSKSDKTAAVMYAQADYFTGPMVSVRQRQCALGANSNLRVISLDTAVAPNVAGRNVQERAAPSAA